jgi:tryptophan halogenase
MRDAQSLPNHADFVAHHGPFDRKNEFAK